MQLQKLARLQALFNNIKVTSPNKQKKSLQERLLSHQPNSYETTI